MSDHKKQAWKYCYWLDDETLTKLLTSLSAKNIFPVKAEKNPCEVLRGDIGYAIPPVWGVICKYDAEPWYRSAKHVGKNLIASSFPLEESFSCFLETTIETTSLTPSFFPSLEELHALAHDTIYTTRLPEGWGKFPQEMGETIIKGLKKMSGKPLANFKELLTIWDAVHSNFVNPQYRTEVEDLNAPYSVIDSIHIGTCCVELFNLMDSKEKAMLVRPCIGSVIVGVLEKDRYYLVRVMK